MKDLPKRRVRTEVIRSAEIRMVEKVIELKTDSQHGIFPMRNLCVLHDAEIRVEIAWIAEMVASLSDRNSGAAA